LGRSGGGGVGGGGGGWGGVGLWGGGGRGGGEGGVGGGGGVRVWGGGGGGGGGVGGGGGGGWVGGAHAAPREYSRGVPGQEIPESTFSARTRYTATEHVKIAVAVRPSSLSFSGPRASSRNRESRACRLRQKRHSPPDTSRQLIAHNRVLRRLSGKHGIDFPIVNPILRSHAITAAAELLSDF